MLLRAIVVGLTFGATVPVLAEVAPAPVQQAPQAMDIAALGKTLLLGDLMDILRAEGLDYGKSLHSEMFPDSSLAGWQGAVSKIYDAKVMQAAFEATLAAELAQDPETVAAAIGFFGSDQGQNILRLELEARRVLLDERAETAAKLAVEEMQTANPARYEALQEFAEANDLIESNVMGALNANLAFYKGLNAAGAFETEMPESEMLSEVWSQETSIREETAVWLYAYLGLAYQGLSDKDLAEYIAFSRSPAGKRLNAVTFAAFDAAFSGISFALGEAAGKQMQGSDI